MDLAVTLFR